VKSILSYYDKSLPISQSTAEVCEQSVVCCGYLCSFCLFIRDGPKFGRRRSLAECSARFGSATCDYLAEVQPNFGKHSASFVASHLQRFALAAGVN